MSRFRRMTLVLATVWATAMSGCNLNRRNYTEFEEHDDSTIYDATSLHPEIPAVDSDNPFAPEFTGAPITLSEDEPREYWDLKLEEAIAWALSNSRVLRDLGGMVLRSPTTSRTIQDPAITETDPRFGVDATLSYFDAQFAYSGYFEKNDRALNNVFFGGGTRLLQQDGHVYQTQIAKRAVTGAEFTLRNNTDYDSNNAPGNQFFSSWNTNIEALVRQPLLQGGGVDFNRIYGPAGIPGLPMGVLLARINTDASLADFELGVRSFVSDIENAYWDLYFAYRELDAQISARDAALETWRRVVALHESGRADDQQEAQAREQYFRFQEEVQNSLAGRLVEGTRSNSGTTGGTFRATTGVQTAERRLRLMMGVPISDGKLIRPADEPALTQSVFDWNVVLAEALTRRPELRRQKWIIKRREMELLGSKNYLLPRLDALGRYRWRGFGKDLMDQNVHNLDGQFNNAWGNLLGGNFQEWQLGFEFSMPLGFRRGHVTVRNAELQLCRERNLLNEQEREIVLDLSNSIAELNRAYLVAQTAYNRRAAARQQLSVLQATEERYDPKLYIVLVLDAQRRLADAEIQYYRALVEHELAVKNVHLEKGSILEYDGVMLSELPSPAKAYEDAYAKIKLRTRAPRFAEKGLEAEIVSEGPVPQKYQPSVHQPAASVHVPEPAPALPESRRLPEVPADRSPPQVYDEADTPATTQAVPSAEAEEELSAPVRTARSNRTGNRLPEVDESDDDFDQAPGASDAFEESADSSAAEDEVAEEE